MYSLKNMAMWIAGTAFSLLLFVLPTSAQDAPKLTDPEISSVAVTANQIDVDYGKIALKRSRTPKIKQFAQTMINDHGNIIKQAAGLAEKLGVVPKDNPVTQQLLEGAKKTIKNLNSSKGSAFDKAYIDNEVAYHEAVISAVKKVLIPQTQNSELKALLIKVSPLLVAHLNMARKVQKELK